MDKLKLTRNASRIMLITVIVATMASCTQTTDWLKGRRTAEADDPIILGAPEADSYLDELRALAAGDPATQAEIFADAESAATLTPGPNTSLRLAMVLATPGHAGSSPEKAQSLLREVLAQTELLTPAEISLATIHLNYVERFIVANAEARRLRATNSRVARTEEQAISQRLNSVEAENRVLRRELEAAEDKLEAITSIERSIREQE
ncbi:MAG: hypothetical protein ACR2QI_10005 [Woeseiaceae bacterium]